MIVTTTPAVEGRKIVAYKGIVFGEKALAEMSERAAKLGADAVVGVDVDYEVLGETNGMLMVSVSGTAVKLD